MVECEAAKASANAAVGEASTSHSALIQATNRLQQLDNECSKYKADIMLLRRECEAQGAELRRRQGVSSLDTDKLSTAETELRWLKSATQAETQRLNSRIGEIEALNVVLRTQVRAGTVCGALWSKWSNKSYLMWPIDYRCAPLCCVMHVPRQIRCPFGNQLVVFVLTFPPTPPPPTHPLPPHTTHSSTPLPTRKPPTCATCSVCWTRRTSK